jgi:hypothetical protein
MSAVSGNHCFGGDAWRNSNEDCKIECNQQKEENKREEVRERESNPSDLGNWRRDGRTRTCAAWVRISEAEDEDEEEEAAVGAIQRL